MRTFLFLPAFFFLIVFTSSTYAVTVHVPDDFLTIQAGIDACTDGDTVIVRDGTYTGDGNRDIDFTGKAIVLMSENGPEVTVIDCEGNSSDYHRGFYFHSGEDSGSVLQGFTITNGYYTNGGGIYCFNSSPTITGNIIADNSTREVISGFGGGIYCYNSSLVITDNVISGNFAFEGGGIYSGANTSPTITSNTITKNHAFGDFGDGGGIYCMYSSPTIAENVIDGNFAFQGGGVSIYESSPTLVDNMIFGNTAEGCCGGLLSWYSNSIITGNTIMGNSAWEEGGMVCDQDSATIDANIISGNTSSAYGAGMGVGRGIFTVSNNLITNNTVTTDSLGVGGILVWNASATLNNNTLVDNYANAAGGLWVADSSTVNITNTVFWNNNAATGDEIGIINYYSPTLPSTLTISYSDVKGGQSSVFVDKGCTLNWGGGMIDADPLFGSFHDFDYLLRQGSPCIDAGDPMIEDGISDWHPRWPEWYPNGPRSDMGAYGGPGNKRWLPYRKGGVPVDVSWRQLGFNAQRTSYNPYEQQIGPSNVGDLEVLWTHGFSSSIRLGVSIVDGIAYYGTYGGEVYASDAATGARIWTQSLMGKHQGQSVVDGVVYVTAANTSGPLDGMVYAFDALTGDPIWTWDPNRRVGCPIVADGVVYVTSYYQTDPIQALDAETGGELWTSAVSGGDVAVSNGVVFTNNAGTLRALSSENGELLWTGIVDEGNLTRPVVANGVIYMNSDVGYLFAFDASGCGQDSCTPLWAGVTEELQQGDGPQSPAMAEGKVYLGVNSSFYAFDANGCGEPKCFPLWNTSTPVPFFSSQSPSVANGVVYSTCGNNYIYAFDASTGDVLWQYSTSGGYPMRSSPTILDGRLFHGATFNYTLYAFALPY